MSEDKKRNPQPLIERMPEQGWTLEELRPSIPEPRFLTEDEIDEEEEK